MAQHGQASKLHPQLKRPNLHRWERLNGCSFPAYKRGRLAAVVSIDNGEHHLSLSKFPEIRPTDDECQSALRDFCMEGARESNSKSHRADTRHFWLADRSLLSGAVVDKESATSKAAGELSEEFREFCRLAFLRADAIARDRWDEIQRAHSHCEQDQLVLLHMTQASAQGAAEIGTRILVCNRSKITDTFPESDEEVFSSWALASRMGCTPLVVVLSGRNKETAVKVLGSAIKPPAKA
jgi:hypothetical protein